MKVTITGAEPGGGGGGGGALDVINPLFLEKWVCVFKVGMSSQKEAPF